MPTILLLLVGVLVVAVCAAVFALQADRQRRAIVERANAFSGTSVQFVRPANHGARARLMEWLVHRTSGSLTVKEEVKSRLVQAGYEGAAAASIFALLRIGCAVTLPALAVLLAPRTSSMNYLAFVALGAAVGLMGPPAVLDRLAQARQERLRRSLPDAMDLLVVCVEAGISVDAALLRVAREMAHLHPELANEFLVVNRRVNAGMPREQALHGLWLRTGLEDLRTLASSMIQAEKWGTSIATVLRVYAETTRRKRKQAAEKKAAVAPMKMMVPTVIFIFPTLFVALLGPAAISIGTMLGAARR